jgi:hypothetical protein
MSYHIISIYIYISYNTIYYIQSLQKLENFGVEMIFHHELPAATLKNGLVSSLQRLPLVGKGLTRTGPACPPNDIKRP